ncbi:MAG TPA: phenylacetic acid degradation protein PaaN, partial [Nocardioidaceae bacterium]|nr:phenylacetic acid degradation protein PaaN [Nocardioidaceae bacterium]
MSTLAVDSFARHRETLDGALEAIRTRGYFSAYPESPSPRVYGESAAADGQAAFDGVRKSEFSVLSPGASGIVATEKSPFGLPLDVAYPRMTAAG